MDAPDQTPFWPSATGPNVPDFNAKNRENRKVDMDTALAWLRRELAAIQLQDRNMHKQLLAMRSSICDLKDELKNERERWEIEGKERWEVETQQKERGSDLKPSPGNVTKVEPVKNKSHRDELRINHAKQDSGILTDEEGSEDEGMKESTQLLLKTFPPAVSPRSSSFLATARRSNSLNAHSVKHYDNEGRKMSDRRTGNVFRARARSLASTGIERSSSASFSFRRSHTQSDGAVSRFGSMPVINEIPSDTFERNIFRTKAFAVYGCRRSESADDNTCQSSFSVPKSLPAFGSLTRHSSMPVMYRGGRPKSGDDLSRKREKRTPSVNISQPVIKRSASQMILSRPTFEETARTKGINLHKMYRSTSQISLV